MEKKDGLSKVFALTALGVTIFAGYLILAYAIPIKKSDILSSTGQILRDSSVNNQNRFEFKNKDIKISFNLPSDWQINLSDKEKETLELNDQIIIENNDYIKWRKDCLLLPRCSVLPKGQFIILNSWDIENDFKHPNFDGQKVAVSVKGSFGNYVLYDNDKKPFEILNVRLLKGDTVFEIQMNFVRGKYALAGGVMNQLLDSLVVE